jgi:hypothetical protein
MKLSGNTAFRAVLPILTSKYNSIRKGVQISSYLISIALITAGFKQQIDLYMLPTINTTSSPRCVSLSFSYVKISLVHSSETRCVLSSGARCVFKIYNVTRFMLQ